MTPQSTRQKILLAAIAAIEKHGIQNLTTRLIAEEAGVNNAALHYYYGTKEQLLDAALEQTLKHWVEDTMQIMASEEPIRRQLYELFSYLIEGVLQYPNLIRAHIRTPLFDGISDSAFLQLLTEWIDLAAAGISAAAPQASITTVRMAVQSAVSTVLIVGLLPPSKRLVTSLSLQDPASREDLINYLISSILLHVEAG